MNTISSFELAWGKVFLPFELQRGRNSRNLSLFEFSIVQIWIRGLERICSNYRKIRIIEARIFYYVTFFAHF